MAFTFEQLLAADPSNPANVAQKLRSLSLRLAMPRWPR